MESSESIPSSRESRRIADSIKARAETELSAARKTVRDLALKIEEANSRTKRMQHRFLKSREQEERETPMKNNQHSGYTQAMQEIEKIKHELHKLKLDMNLVSKEKKHAEKTCNASSSKTSALSSAVERIKKEIEELDEEHVLVELARIEAVKERDEIEAKRKEEVSYFKIQLEKVKQKVKDNELQLTLYNENSLEKKSSPDLLQKVIKELEMAKAELAEVKREGFDFMASMDVIRTELVHVKEQKSRLEKEESKVNLTIQTLKSKIQKGKAKLESVTATTDKAISIASNLAVTVEHLTSEAETAKKEREIIVQEIENVKLEIPKTESEIELSEERLEVAMEELKMVKSSEFSALEKLKTFIDSTVRARELTGLNKSTITITNFEYEYLTERAGGAEEIADKKVAAAQAWVEALKANEKEIVMKTETGRREIGEVRVEMGEDDVAVYGTERGGRRRSVDGVSGVRVVASPRRSMSKVGNVTPGKRGRSLLSPATRQAIKSASFSKRREKVTRNLETLLDETDEMVE